MKKLIFLLIFVAYFYGCKKEDGKPNNLTVSGWTLMLQDSSKGGRQETAPYNFKSVYFTDINTGYAVGNIHDTDFNYKALVLKTNNAGKTWFPTVLSEYNTLQSVYFPSANIGYAVGLGSTQGSGIILKTVNGGANWNLLLEANIDVDVSESVEYTSIYFTDVNIGYVIGIDSYFAGKWITNTYILQTKDGGATWNRYTKGTNGLNFKDFTGKINGGTVWATLSNITGMPTFFIDTITGYSINGGTSTIGGMKKTIDGGISWNGITMPKLLSNYSLNSLYFTNNNAGYVLSQGTIFETLNGGNTWNTIYPPSIPGQDLNAIYFTNANTGYIVGNSAIILKTTTGGR